VAPVQALWPAAVIGNKVALGAAGRTTRHSAAHWLSTKL
jgi:hypothetical protein